jgi:Ca-activated chloride channel family protein
MLEFAWPWIFLTAPLPWLFRRLLPLSTSRDVLLQVSFIGELESIAGRRRRGRVPTWRKQLPLILIWVLLLIAAARPEWPSDAMPQPISGRDLLLAVDVSGSMDYPDMEWEGQPASRLTLVKHLLGDFIEGREGDRLGLILFGSRAYLQAPLTFDRRTVRTWLDEAIIGIAGKNTAIGDTIGLAVKRLRDRPADSRVLVLITDGADNGSTVSPATAARLAAEENVRIYAIGIGADPGPGSLGLLGFTPGFDLDEPLLRSLAERTKGAYFRARNHKELAAISEALDMLEPVQQQPSDIRFNQPLYPWPLGIALLLSIAMVAGGTGLLPAWGRRLGDRT